METSVGKGEWRLRFRVAVGPRPSGPGHRASPGRKARGGDSPLHSRALLPPRRPQDGDVFAEASRSNRGDSRGQDPGPGAGSDPKGVCPHPGLLPRGGPSAKAPPAGQTALCPHAGLPRPLWTGTAPGCLPSAFGEGGWWDRVLDLLAYLCCPYFLILQCSKPSQHAAPTSFPIAAPIGHQVD